MHPLAGHQPHARGLWSLFSVIGALPTLNERGNRRAAVIIIIIIIINGPINHLDQRDQKSVTNTKVNYRIGQALLPLAPLPLLNGGGGRREFRSHRGESSKNFWNPLSSSAAQTQILKQLRTSKNTPWECGDGVPLSHFTSAGPGAGLGCEDDTEGLGGCPGGRCTSVRSAESRTEPRKSAQRRVRKSLGRRQSARHRPG